MTKQATLTGDVETTVVNKTKTDRYTVYIGRATEGEATKHINSTAPGERGWLGNPYPESDYGRERCIELFREDFIERLEDDEFRDRLDELEGETLGCYCKPEACHGDVIAAYLDGGLEAIDTDDSSDTGGVTDE